MKSKIKILCICLGILLISCSDDFLVRHPLDRLSDAALTYTPDQVRMYVNQWYERLTFGERNIFHYDTGTDNLFSTAWDNNPDLVDTRIVSGAGGWGTTEWGRIRSVNFLLNNYQRSKELDRIMPFVGEAYFFRAFFYFEQFLKPFGGVPWFEEVPTMESPELFMPRMKRHEVANLILADLDKAIQYIPSADKQLKGRISKEVAQLYKARVALYEGTWEKYHAGTVYAGEGNVSSYLQAARDASLAVINSGNFALDNVGKQDGYYMLFNQHSYANSKEIMLWRQYDRGLGVIHDQNRQMGRNGGSVGLSRWLVESYLVIDPDGKARPISLASNYKGDDNILTVCANRDPRLTQTMFFPGRARTIENKTDTTIIFVKPNITLSGVEKNATGYELAKGADPDGDEQHQLSGSIKGLIIFRYAEALLIHAEARAELNELTQADLDKTINLLRNRVGMPHLTLDPGYVDPQGQFTAFWKYDGVPVSNILAEVRRERRIELACEGYRHDDLNRWRAFHYLNSRRIQGAKMAQFFNLTWLKDFFETFPIPQHINGGRTYFLNNTVPVWSPGLVANGNYWIDADGYFEPFQRNIPGGYFIFNKEKGYLRPINPEQLVLNDKLEQNPGWSRN